MGAKFVVFSPERLLSVSQKSSFSEWYRNWSVIPETIFSLGERDSAQRSSNEYKTLLLKKYSWHVNILNTI